MIIGHVYRGDDNDILKWLQHEEYRGKTCEMFHAARIRLHRADLLLEGNLAITKQANRIRSIDHRILQDAHDILAALYRVEWDDGCQLRINETPEQQDERYVKHWNQWFEDKVNEVCDNNYRFIRAVIQSVVFDRTKIGYMAESDVCRQLLMYFCTHDECPSLSYNSTYFKDYVAHCDGKV